MILPSAALSVMLSAPALAVAAPADAGSPAPSAVVAGAEHQPAFLGVYAEPVPAEVAAALPEAAAAGVIVIGVAPQSPAAKAGIAPNDIILRVGDTPVGTLPALVEAVRKCQAGQAVEVTYLHQGKRTTAKVKLGAYPGAATPAAPEKAEQPARAEKPEKVEKAEKPAKPERPAPGQPAAAPGFLGVGVAPLPADLTAHFGFQPGQGVWIRELAPNGPAAQAGLQVHDIILKAAGQPVGSQDQLARVIAERRAGERIAIESIRQGQRMGMKATLGRREGPPPPAWPRAGADAEDGIAKAREAMARREQAMRQAAEERAREMEKLRQATEERIQRLREREKQEREGREERVQRMREMEKQQRQSWENTQRERREDSPPAAEQADREHRNGDRGAATPPSRDDEMLRQLKALGEQIERLGRQVESLERERDSRR
jgi:hypothetical protein